MDGQFKWLFLSRLEQLMEENPTYTIGDCLYSILRKSCLPSKPQSVKTAWLREIEDRELYGAVEYTINQETQSDES